MLIAQPGQRGHVVDTSRRGFVMHCSHVSVGLSCHCFRHAIEIDRIRPGVCQGLEIDAVNCRDAADALTVYAVFYHEQPRIARQQG